MAPMQHRSPSRPSVTFPDQTKTSQANVSVTLRPATVILRDRTPGPRDGLAAVLGSFGHSSEQRYIPLEFPPILPRLRQTEPRLDAATLSP
jgi:hypothetical protein